MSDLGFDGMVDTRRGSMFFPEHYKVKEIKSMGAVRACFPDGEANQYNWLFLSTSGVHGTYETLDDYDEWTPNEEEEDLEPPEITVVIVQPRLCNLFYGHLTITKEDVPYLRHLVASTIEGIQASQKGNFPSPSGDDPQP